MTVPPAAPEGPPLLKPFRPGQIVRIRDQRWIVVRHLAYVDGAILEVSGCDRSGRPSRARFLLPAERVDVLPASRALRIVRPAEVRHIARHTLAQGLSAQDLLRTIVAARADILPFQLEPALAVISGLGSRVLIADEVGLGKTVQAALIVAELLARAPDAHVLIVSPAGLREQWRDELELRFRLDATLVDSTTLGRPGTGSAVKSNPWRSHGVVVASIDYVKRPEVLRSLEATIWDALIFDEAHELSGHSDRAVAAAALAARARKLVLLSATPHSGDDSAFTQLCSVGDLSGGFPLMVFRRTRREVGLPSARRVIWLRVRATDEETALHEALMSYARHVWNSPVSSSGARLAMSVLVRRACSSATSLARSVERRLTLLESERTISMGGGGLPSRIQPLLPLGGLLKDDEEPSAALMAPGFADPEHEQRRLREILELARVAANQESKLRALSRLLRRAREPLIVFTEYRDTLARVAECVRDLAIVTLHGGLTATERSECLGEFTRGGAQVLIATDAASQGLNLQHRCRMVVNLELPWSPLRLEQRIGRVDRLGQRRRVHGVHFVAGGTAEETTVARLLLRIDRMQSSTAGLQRPVLDENDVAREVIGGQRAGDGGNEVVLASNLVIPELQSAARSEACRARMARRLGRGDRSVAAVHRPVASRIARWSEVPRCYWAFRLRYEDAGGLGQSDVVIGVTEPIWRLATGTTASVRKHLGRRMADAVAAATREQWKTLGQIQDRHRISAELAMRRELAILAAARQHHARVAARLLQPGLFDHRAERLAAAQSSLLDAVLTEGTAHLRALERSTSLRVGECELVFAIVFG